ncbi:MAG: hypothetical protein MUO21_03000 [Nitrososphaeraceae archaeon]|nr:hypothetical protein [Nitrososphaeraceae archaeon]
MASLESYRSDGMRDRRAGYAKCDYPEKLNYEEASWWRAGWELEDKKQQSMKLHPLRCETCKYAAKLILDASNIICSNPNHDPYPDVYACSKQKGKWMPYVRDGNPIAIVGCASHSDFKQSLDILERLYKEFGDARSKYATSKLSLEYLEGRCDAIDLAIQRVDK